MPVCNRRDFLKTLGLAGTAATVGCSRDTGRRLIPYVIPDEDIIPGEPAWYATTCRECPAGCGLHAKNRDGRIIKVEGNPAHPINRGTLCPRGQASLHGLFNPDRFTGPLMRQAEKFTPASRAEAEKGLVARLRELHELGRGGRVVFMSGLMNGTMVELIAKWLAELGGGEHLIYEPFAFEPLRAANRIVFGEDGIPGYRLDQADLIISLGAGFLETWLSNVEYARQFADFHAPRDGSKNFFVYAGPRLSLTAASADLRLLLPPVGELVLAMALIEKLLAKAAQGRLALAPGPRAALEKVLGANSWSNQAGRFNISSEVIEALANRFVNSQRPLVLPPGLAHSSPQATAIAVAANLLNLIKPGSRELIDFGPASALDSVAPAARIKELVARMAAGEIDLLLMHEVNPVFSLPPSWEFGEHLKKIKTIVSLSSWPDETTAHSHLVLPGHTFLESWGDYSPRAGIHGLLQPVMGPLFDTRHQGDLLLAMAREAGFGQNLPWPGFYELLRERWQGIWQESGSPANFESFWQQALHQGGLYKDDGHIRKPPALAAGFNHSLPLPADFAGKGREWSLTIYPTIQFFDGRMANRPWLQELPDPVTQVAWGGWVEMHPQTAAGLQVTKGDVVRLSTEHGAIEAPVLPIPTVLPGVVAIPIGQGHSDFGRYATGMPANPLALLLPDIDPASGGILTPQRVSISKAGSYHAIANTDGSYFEQGRNYTETEPFSAHLTATAAGRLPELDMPLPEGIDPEKDFYPPHEHKELRWCMVVDLDRCIGCGACVVACHAENNVAIVLRQQLLKGREMSWLRIQRYFTDNSAAIRFLPMLCQHCDQAPCESVCPIFAPHHSPDGLNNQVYNRCLGTRFCSQNDPYKVRRFNWFTFTRPYPLDLQLNPDVTVRQKGIMEKCSFCVQRIVAAKFKAKKEDRKLGDGEFTTACAQTCPVQAITFGNLLDPDSRVAKLIKSPRTYQVQRHLNTKPAVFYLKKLTQELA